MCRYSIGMRYLELDWLFVPVMGMLHHVLCLPACCLSVHLSVHLSVCQQWMGAWCGGFLYPGTPKLQDADIFTVMCST